MGQIEAVQSALEVLSLTALITITELKSHYHRLAKEAHPDYGGSVQKMVEINEAYAIIKKYMEEFKFTFSDEELGSQFPQELYANRFRF